MTSHNKTIFLDPLPPVKIFIQTFIFCMEVLHSIRSTTPLKYEHHEHHLCI